MSIKQQRASTQGLVVVSWSWCCGLCSFYGERERVFFGEGKPDLKYDTFFFCHYLLVVYSSPSTLWENGAHHTSSWLSWFLFATRTCFLFFSQHFSCCLVGLLCLQLVSSLPTVCVFFSLFHFTSTCFRYFTCALVVFFCPYLFCVCFFLSIS